MGGKHFFEQTYNQVYPIGVFVLSIFSPRRRLIFFLHPVYAIFVYDFAGENDVDFEDSCNPKDGRSQIDLLRIANIKANQAKSILLYVIIDVVEHKIVVFVAINTNNGIKVLHL